MNEKYKNIQTKEDYFKLLETGMFFEFHPELSGNWQDDEKVINGNEIGKVLAVEKAVSKPNKKDYDFNDLFDSANFASDMIKYCESIELQLECFHNNKTACEESHLDCAHWSSQEMGCDGCTKKYSQTES